MKPGYDARRRADSDRARDARVVTGRCTPGAFVKVFSTTDFRYDRSPVTDMQPLTAVMALALFHPRAVSWTRFRCPATAIAVFTKFRPICERLPQSAQ